MDTCACVSVKEGFSRDDDGIWVHAKCRRPTFLYYQRAVLGKGVPDEQAVQAVSQVDTVAPQQ